jgi:hypothetical protein
MGEKDRDMEGERKYTELATADLQETNSSPEKKNLLLNVKGSDYFSMTPTRTLWVQLTESWENR